MEGQYGEWLRADLSKLGNKRTIQRDQEQEDKTREQEKRVK